MEFLSAIGPFLGIGLLGALFSRFTGVNMSMCMLMLFLYLGARPGEAIVAMLLFNAFTFFTTYSQEHAMNMKNFTFFPGVRFIIPVAITVVLAALSPFAGIIFFIIVFLMEIFARQYREMDAKTRPAKGKIVQMCVIASLCAVVGVALVPLISETYYYAVSGMVILAFSVLMWLAGDRRKWTGAWDKILYAAAFFAGVCGFDTSDWLQAMKRSNPSPLSQSYSIVMHTAIMVALVAAYALYRYFPLSALFTTVGAAVGIRFFGIYVHSSKGKFSYVTLSLAVLAALVFMIIQPEPAGLPVLPESEQSPSFFNF